MPRNSINRLLDQLDESKHRFAAGEHKRTEKLLARLNRTKLADAASLIRFHEALLFLSAYPQSARIKRMAESALKSFGKKVAALREAEIDLSALDSPEVSGIAGTAITDTLSYYIVRWLVRRHSTQVTLDWDWYEDENHLAETWPRFMPLLEEDAFVEANVPYEKWLSTATGRSAKELAWLIARFESLPKADKERAELFDSQKLYARWSPGFRATRTGMRLPVRKIFYQRDSLIRRRDVSLSQELENPSPRLERLTRKQGEAILDMAREASTVRYRELYGFTHGDANRVFKASPGRGVDIFVMGVPPERRLPLRAYHSAMIFKNGVPVGYFEGLSLFERMESGFNLYYTFRDGETAWIYARTLNIFRHLLGVTAFSIDPYQIGFENEEGIESGAFWFYRKLGFRPTRSSLLKLAMHEETKIARRPAYRTGAKVLRKLAEAPMIFELDKTKTGDWDRFQVRNLGFAVQRRMAAQFKGDAEKIRSESVNAVSRVLGISKSQWRGAELTAFSDFAVVLAQISDLNQWSNVEKQQAVRIIQAKAGADEARYLKLMQRHARLRSAMVKLGS